MPESCIVCISRGLFRLLLHKAAQTPPQVFKKGLLVLFGDYQCQKPIGMWLLFLTQLGMTSSKTNMRHRVWPDNACLFGDIVFYLFQMYVSYIITELVGM